MNERKLTSTAATYLASSSAVEANETNEPIDFEFIPPGQIQPVDQQKSTGPIEISHVADYYSRYPGEPLALFTKITLAQAIHGLTIRISIPDAVQLDDYRLLDSPLLPEITHTLAGSYLVWTLPGLQDVGSEFNVHIEATVAEAVEDARLLSSAAAFAGASKPEAPLTDAPIASNDITVQIRAKGDYLRYLPALYERDDLMGRFLMLFESFWSPIDGQLDNIWDYLDTTVAPAPMLPWLASWFGMTLDEGWSEDRQRKLLQSLVHLYRKRGTRIGLQEYLEIFTQCKVEIHEHRANDFVVGRGGKLGAGIALGRGNSPHTFTVKVTLPPEPPRRLSNQEQGESHAEDEQTSKRAQEQQALRRMIEKIIDAEKPAHTGYDLTFVDGESIR